MTRITILNNSKISDINKDYLKIVLNSKVSSIPFKADFAVMEIKYYKNNRSHDVARLSNITLTNVDDVIAKFFYLLAYIDRDLHFDKLVVLFKINKNTKSEIDHLF